MLTTKYGYFLLYLLLSALVSSILCALIYADLKNDIAHKLESISISYNSDTTFESKLYYSFDSTFNEKRVVYNTSKKQGELFFPLSNNDSILTNVRLDLDPESFFGYVTIQGLTLTFSDKIININSDELNTVFFVNSPSVRLNKDLAKITFLKNQNPFDPYVIFNPLAQIIKQSYPFTYALCAPYILFGILLLFKLRFSNTTIFEILTLLFIITIPLKIAWTTLLALLISAYLVFEYLKLGKKQYNKQLPFFFLGVFLIPLVFGRPRGVADFDIQMGFIVFVFLGAFVENNMKILYKQYIVIFTILFTMILSFGIVFLSNFESLYGQPVWEYFVQIKTYSGNVRNWLYYDHATFLSFFGLIGLLFAQDLYITKEIARPILIVYHLFLFGFILLMGARICLIIYLVYIGNSLVQYNSRERLIANGLVYLGFVFFLLKNIALYDFYRSELWKKSWEAIKLKPFFGYGLGRSNDVLHSVGLEDLGANTLPSNLNHSHNQFITLLLEIGFFGTTMLSIFVLFFIYMKKWYNNTIFVLYGFGLLYLMFTESVFQTSKPVYVLSFLLLMVAKYIKNEEIVLKVK